MSLADREGRLTRWEELLDELTTQQVVVLMAYHRLHPWGEEREDRRQAIMTAAICSAVSMSGQSVDPSDLLSLLRPSSPSGGNAVPASPEVAAALFRQQYMPGGT